MAAEAKLWSYDGLVDQVGGDEVTVIDCGQERRFKIVRKAHPLNWWDVELIDVVTGEHFMILKEEQAALKMHIAVCGPGSITPEQLLTTCGTHVFFTGFYHGNREECMAYAQENVEEILEASKRHPMGLQKV